MAMGSSFGWAFLLGLKFGTKTNLFGRMEGLLFSLTEMRSQGRCGQNGHLTIKPQLFS